MEQISSHFSNLQLNDSQQATTTISNISNISNGMNNIDLNNQSSQSSQFKIDSSVIDNYIDTNIEENLYNTNDEHKYLPLEVRNYYSTKYFDDEDFIYFNLSIQPYILNSRFYAEYSSYENKYDNLINYYNDLLENLPKQDMLNIDTYHKLVSIYIVVLQFYKTIYKCNDEDVDGTNNFSIAIKMFNHTMIKEIVDIINYLYEEIDLDCNSENNEHFTIMEKEIIFGIRLITSHINIIVNFYNSHSITFEDYSEHHQVRLIRLINNLCVVMIFMKLYHIDYNSDVNVFTQFSEHNHIMNS